MPNVHIFPSFDGPDKADGGVRRVLENQWRYLPATGWTPVPDVEMADVINAHITIPETYLNRFPRTPLVMSCHGMYWSQFEWENWAIKANAHVMELCRVADLITVPSEWVAQVVRRHTLRRPIVIPHGVNLEEWTIRDLSAGCVCPPKEMEVAGIKVGIHLEDCPGESKGAYVLWNKTRVDPVTDPASLDLVAAAMPDVQFRSTYAKRAPNVESTGPLPYSAAKQEVQGASAYLATTMETFGIGTLEALASGVPVVGWRWGGQAEFITQGEDGWLATPGDYEDLEKGIRWALQARQDGKTPQRCRATAESFPWSAAAEMYAEVYSQALHRKWVRATDPIAEKPKVSVVMPAHNAERWIEAAVSSVVAQSLIDWELIIVDDASTDGTMQLIASEANSEPRITVAHNETNLGAAATRNHGLRLARGEYVIQLDADDQLTPSALETLSAALDADRRIHIAYGGVQFVEEDGVTLTDYGHGDGHSGWPIDFRFDWQLRPPSPESGNRPPNLIPYCAMVRRDALELVGGYRERFVTAEDPDLWCRLSSYGFRPRMVTTQDVLIYRNHPGSLSRSQQPTDWSLWYPWSRVVDLAPAGAVTEKQLPIHSCDPPLVSVIIPVGPGHEGLVIDAIDSVDAQSFRQWECIVVNDTGYALPALPSWVRIVDRACEADICGPAAARNAGVRAANAKLFLPLDADDILDPRCLELMLTAHQETSEIIYSDFFEDPKSEGEYQIYRTPPWDAALLTRNGAVSAVTQLTPKWVWEQVGGYDETLPAWEDWAFQIAYAAQGICARRLPLALWTYRKHTGFRREQNNSRDKEAGKAAIIKKFDGRFWSEHGPAKEELMGCRSCRGGNVDPKPMQFNRAPADGGAQLVEYVGNQRGAPRTIKTYIDEGMSGTVYKFDPDDGPFFVLEQDLAKFTERPSEYRLVTQATSMAPEETPEPVLTAPKRRKKSDA